MASQKKGFPKIDDGKCREKMREKHFLLERKSSMHRCKVKKGFSSAP